MVGAIDQRSIWHRGRRLRAKTRRRERHCETHGTAGSWWSRAFLARQRRARANLQRTTACAVRHERPACIRRKVGLAATRSRPPLVANASRNIESPRFFARSIPVRADVLRRHRFRIEFAHRRHVNSAMSACSPARAGAISSNARDHTSLEPR